MLKTKKNNIADVLAAVLLALFVVFFVWLSFWRHDALQSYLNDLGSCDQIIWNTLQGNFFDNSANMLGAQNYLAAHFSLIMLFFVPFYAILASPKWLLFFQVLAVGAGAVPIYLMAKEKLKNSGVAFIFLVSYLLNPFLHNALLYDFHEVVFGVVFVAWAFYFLDKKNNKLFVISSVLLAICQEHLVLLVFMMGLYAFFIQRRKKFGFWVCAGSLLYFVSVLAVFMPYFSQTGSLALLEDNVRYGSRYAWLGSSLPEIIKNVAYYPDGVLRVLASRDRFVYLAYLILPVFSLGAYSWPIIITFPILAINLLSSNAMTYDIFFYHSAIAIPFVYFSAIFTFRTWFLEDKFLRRPFLFLILFFSFLTFYFFSLLGISGTKIFAEYRPDAHAKRIAEVQNIIPEDASLSVQHNLGPHFSQRKEIHRFPLKKDETEYILLDQTNPYEKNISHFSDFGYALQMEVAEWQKYITELMKSPQYKLIYQKEGYLIFRKN